MPSTASQILRLELIGTGDQAGTWGNTTNTNLGTLLEGAIAGLASVSVTSANQALTATDYAADQARMAILTLTTTTLAVFNVYAPPVSKTYVIFNNSAYNATIYNSTVLGNTTAAGLGVTIPAGRIVSVWSNGTNFYKSDTALVNLSTDVTGTLPFANGGTGETSRQAAMDALAGAVTSGFYLRGNGSDVVMSAIQVADVPTLNQNTTGSAGSVVNAVTFNTSGGAAAGTTFNGSAARTIDYSTVGAPSTTGTGASGTWGISISGNAATATTVANGAITAEKLSGAQTGSAPVYGFRAWVNFNGTGSIGTNQTINASGNVSSVYKNSDGDYTINFSTALPNANYAVSGSVASSDFGYGVVVYSTSVLGTPATKTASALRIAIVSDGGNFLNPTNCSVMIVG